MKNKKIAGILIIIILITVVGIFLLNRKDSTKKGKNIEIEEIYATLTDAYIYGTHLNINGTIKVNETDIEDVMLLLVNQEEKLEYNLKYEINESELQFTTSEYINKGIDLEKISKNNYCFLISVKEKSKQNKYYSIKIDNVKLEELEYYTISNNNRTNYITFKEIQRDDNFYMVLLSDNIEMPENIYDITIDAGHGGKSSGATNKGYKESDIVLDYSLALKDLLEKKGIKVALTRSEDVLTEEYGEEGRAVLPNKVKSKYTFSIHLNSFTEVRNGVEVYAPNKADLSFAKNLAKNIVEHANTEYSSNEVDKIYDGVYVRTFTKVEIEDSNKAAIKAGYECYNLTEDTPYLFMIRETGAKITNAYVDGRNKEYGINLYYNSNIGNESYLIELGYINSDKDLKNLLENKEGYLEGIRESIVDLLLNK